MQLKSKVLPHHIITFSALYLLFAWSAFLLIDALNVFGIRDLLVNSSMQVPIIWMHLFREAGITEMLQWTALLTSSFMSFYLFFILKKKEQLGPAAFWGIMSLAFLLMFVEDVFNPRHFLASYTVHFFQSYYPHFNLLDGRGLRIVTEIIFFSLLGLIPLYAIIVYGRYPWKFKKTRLYLLVGYISYGIAVLFNATRFIKDWYVSAGELFHEIVAGGNLLIAYFWNEHYLNHHLIDWLVEESIELVGASTLLAAVISYCREIE